MQEIYEEVVGYKRPPGATRFQKGQSGNPKGRPRKTPAPPPQGAVVSQIASQVARIARTPIKVREGGTERTIDKLEAALLQLGRKAASGDVPATRLLLQYVETHDREAAMLASQAAAERAQVKASWERYVVEARKEIARAQKHGVPEPVFWPHPDDVKFDDDGRVRICGPVDEASTAYFAELAKRQHYWLAQMAYDRYLRAKWSARNPTCPTLTWILVSDLSFWWDRSALPGRMQLSESEILSIFHHLLGLSGRRRFLSLQAIAQEIDWPVPPRGLRIPLAVPIAEARLVLDRWTA